MKIKMYKNSLIIGKKIVTFEVKDYVIITDITVFALALRTSEAYKINKLLHENSQKRSS